MTGNYIDTIKETYDFALIIIEKFPEALSDAIYLDGTSTLLLTKLNTHQTFLAIIGSTIAYTIRKSANDYINKNTDSNITIKKVLSGFFAGALKYGITSKTLDKKTLFTGAINNGLYEYNSENINNCIKDGSVIGLFSNLFQIEVLDNIIKGLNAQEMLVSTAKIVGLLNFISWSKLSDTAFLELDYFSFNNTGGLVNKLYNDICAVQNDMMSYIHNAIILENIEIFMFIF